MQVKNLFTKGVSVVVCGIALALVLISLNMVPPIPPEGMSTGETIPPRGMSAEETVAYYYQQYNAKNLQGMQSVCYRDVSATQSNGFPFLLYFRLISCEEHREDVRDDDPQWFGSQPVYDVTVCRVVHELKHWPFFQSLDGHNTFKYYLVKETKDSNWIIVSWGNA